MDRSVLREAPLVHCSCRGRPPQADALQPAVQNRLPQCFGMRVCPSFAAEIFRPRKTD